MNLNDRANPDRLATPGATSGLATPPEITTAGDANPAYWLSRGAMVGLALGASAGSIIPILGTAIGAVGGTAAGCAIGLVMTIVASATRNQFPAEPGTVERRETLACLVTIWIPVLVFRDAAALLAIPAALGSIHALAAGTPIDGKVYTGNVSVLRQRICKLLPVAILLVIAFGWTVRWTTQGSFSV
jgi:hypothetical protein